MIQQLPFQQVPHQLSCFAATFAAPLLHGSSGSIRAHCRCTAPSWLICAEGRNLYPFSRTGRWRHGRLKEREQQKMTLESTM